MVVKAKLRYRYNACLNKYIIVICESPCKVIIEIIFRTCRVEDGDDAVLVVCDGEVSVGECADAGGALQLAGGAAARAELEAELAVGAEALHALVVRVGHDDTT